jgi:hypothetical protein
MAPSTIESAAELTRATGSKPKRTAAAATNPTQRVFWRAVVRSGGTFAASRERDRVEWHLAGCGVPHGEGGHCNEGRHLIETTGQPDGHCMVDGRCGRCGETARLAAAARKAA